MKFNVRKSLSALMVTAMVAGTIAVPSMAAATQEGNISAPNTVVNPIFSIGVPKAVTLTLDPLKLGEGATTQIVSGDYVFTNNSNVVAAIDVSVYASLGANVTLDTKANVPDVAGNTDKVMNLYLKHATALPTESSITYQAEAAAKQLPTDNSYDFTIVLGAGTASGSTATASTVNGASAFSFDGSLNPNATWAAKDVTLTTVYKATALSSAAAIASYEKVTDPKTAQSELGFQTFKETTWGFAFRTYTYSLTGDKDSGVAMALNTANKAIFAAADDVKFSTDALGKTATTAFAYASDEVTYTADAKAKAGAFVTAYAHAVDVDGVILATVPMSLYIVA